ncbi:spidroin-2-like [Cydia splendana]|uniref:spidroin-2-like n=1 Tax=Cydia splendana TaxID=1100963 RepID=UPI0028F472E3
MGQGVLRSLGLLVLLCVSRSTQQSVEKSASASDAARTGQALEDNDKSASASASASAIAQSVGHFIPTSYRPPYYPTTPNYPPSNQCYRADQILHVRDPYGVCQVCVCVQRYGYLEPVCGSCAECDVPWPTPPTTTPAPPYPPPPPPPPPPPTPKCDPMPTNQYFQNPLDPCQVCICKAAEDVYGRPEGPVIECTQNPNCLIPTTPPPPGPPTPFPVCQYYPRDIWFAHPQYACYRCKCEASFMGEVTIDCYPDPACEITTTLAPPTTAAPTPIHVDPLPGPSPHPSCRPYTPGQVFQHPWDPCLECMCIEASVSGIINVQVNCYTKAECCIIPPDPGTYPPGLPQPPGTYIPTPLSPYNNGNYYPGNMGPGQIGSAIANANAFSEINGNGQGTANSIAQAEAAAQAAAQAQAQAQAAAQAAQNNVNQYRPGQDAGSQAAAQAQAIAQAQAAAQAAQNNLNQYQYYPGQDAGSQAAAQAQAIAQAQAAAEAQAIAQAQAAAEAAQNNFNQFQPYPGQDTGSQVQAQALAEALAEAQANSNRAYPGSYPGTWNQGGFQPETYPKKLIIQQPGPYYQPSGNQGFPGGNLVFPGGNQGFPGGNQVFPGGNQGLPGGNQIFPGGNQGFPGGNQIFPGGNQGYPGSAGLVNFGSGVSQAQATSNAQAGYGTAQAQSDAIAQGDSQAIADALAQSNAGYSNGLYGAGRPDSLAQAQGSALSNLYQTGYKNPPYGYGGSGASAQAQAEADLGSAQAMANALAQQLASQAQADASANANVMSQPALYQSPSSYFYPGGAQPVRTNAAAQADAQAVANAMADGDASAQAQASAASAIKTGDSDSQE